MVIWRKRESSNHQGKSQLIYCTISPNLLMYIPKVDFPIISLCSNTLIKKKKKERKREQTVPCLCISRFLSAAENYFESDTELMQVINLNYLCFYIIYVTLSFIIITLMQMFSQRFICSFLWYLSLCLIHRGHNK